MSINEENNRIYEAEEHLASETTRIQNLSSFLVTKIQEELQGKRKAKNMELKTRQRQKSLAATRIQSLYRGRFTRKKKLIIGKRNREIDNSFRGHLSN